MKELIKRCLHVNGFCLMISWESVKQQLIKSCQPQRIRGWENGEKSWLQFGAL